MDTTFRGRDRCPLASPRGVKMQHVAASAVERDHIDVICTFQQTWGCGGIRTSDLKSWVSEEDIGKQRDGLFWHGKPEERTNATKRRTSPVKSFQTAGQLSVILESSCRSNRSKWSKVDGAATMPLDLWNSVSPGSCTGESRASALEAGCPVCQMPDAEPPINVVPRSARIRETNVVDGNRSWICQIAPVRRDATSAEKSGSLVSLSETCQRTS